MSITDGNGNIWKNDAAIDQYTIDNAKVTLFMKKLQARPAILSLVKHHNISID